MTFPVIASFTNDTYALNSSIAYGSAGRAVDLPSVVAGDGIIVTLNVRFGSGSGARFGTFSGYTKIADDGGTTNIAIFWRQCDGTEGSTVTIPTAGDSGGQYSSTVVKYAAANKGDWSITPPEGVIAGFASATNPFAIPTLTPSFSGDTQWLVFMGTQPGTTTLTTYPTGFTDNQTLVSSSVGGSLCKMYYATQDLNTSSLSGLTFVLNQTAVGAAAMVAVAGIGGGGSGFLGNPLVANQTVGGVPATNPGDPIGEIVNQLPGGTFNLTQVTAGDRPGLASIPVGGRRNRLVGTSTLSTQSVNVPAVQMTLSFSGAGTVTLSGAYAAVVTSAGLTFTPTLGSLTLTVSGTVTDAQLNDGAARGGYQQVIDAFNVIEAGVSSVLIPYYDGTDYLNTGVQSFGTASFFTDPAQQWWVGGVYGMFALQGALITKRGAGPTNRNFSVNIGDLLGEARLTLQIRTSAANPTYISPLRADGGDFHIWLLQWDGTDLKLWIDRNSPVTITGLGSAAEQAEEIVVGARTASSPAEFFSGYSDIFGFEDVALNSTETDDLLAWAIQTYLGGNLAANPILGGGSAANPLWGFIA